MAGLRGRTPGHCGVLLSLCLLLVSLALAGVARSHPRAGSAQAYPGVWRVENDRQSYLATAVAIDVDRCLMSAHVLKAFLDRDTTSIRLRQGDRTIDVSRVLRISATYDLALVETDAFLAHHLHHSSYFAAGSVEHRSVGYAEGTFTTLVQTEPVTFETALSHVFAMDRDVLTGMSGSPVLDAKGRFVSLTHSANENLLHAVRPDHVARFIDGTVGVACAAGASLARCFEAAVARTRRMARAGDVVAQFQLGRPSAARGRGGYIAGDVEWLYRSARAGFSEAQRTLGLLHRDRAGDDPAQWTGEENQWFEGAARQSDPVSRNEIALSHFHGIGSPKSLPLALAQVRRAAAQGYSPAMYNLGVFLYHGLGMPADQQAGRRWIEKATGRGYEPPQ